MDFEILAAGIPLVIIVAMAGAFRVLMRKMGQ